MQTITDGTALRGHFDHVSLILRLQKGGITKNISLAMALTDSKTADGEIGAIDERIFNMLRRYLKAWREMHIKTFGPSDPGLSCIPDENGLNWHRLAGGGAATSDACPQAISMSSKIVEKVRETYAQKLGKEAWAALSDEAKDLATRVHSTFCLNHLRATGLRRAVKFECCFLDPLLEVTITDIDPELRVKGKLSAVVRAVSKNFTYEGCKEIYAKGKGLVYFSFTLKHDPTDLVLGVRIQQKHQAKEREKRDGNALQQPDEPPALDATFVGEKIEILEEIQEELDNEEQDNMDVDRSERRSGPRLTYYKQWLPATVVMISTGLEKKQGKKGRSTKVPPGQFFISFDDGENRWIPMKKDDFNCLRVGSWRLDLNFPENRPEDKSWRRRSP
jgi:hypothetical protein